MNKNTKKPIFAGLVGLALAASLLAGCGDDNDTIMPVPAPTAEIRPTGAGGHQIPGP